MDVNFQKSNELTDFPKIDIQGNQEVKTSCPSGAVKSKLFFSFSSAESEFLTFQQSYYGKCEEKFRFCCHVKRASHFVFLQCNSPLIAEATYVRRRRDTQHYVAALVIEAPFSLYGLFENCIL